MNWFKERPILGVTVEKILHDTGTNGRSFFAKVSEIKRVRLFGVLLFKISITGNFPDPKDKLD
jgi:hypothetical protein